MFLRRVSDHLLKTLEQQLENGLAFLRSFLIAFADGPQ